MTSTRNKRKQAEDGDAAAAAAAAAEPTPARRQRRSTLEDGSQQEQQPEQPSRATRTHRSQQQQEQQQQQQEEAVEPPSTARRSTRQRRQQQQQEQQEEQQQRSPSNTEEGQLEQQQQQQQGDVDQQQLGSGAGAADGDAAGVEELDDFRKDADLAQAVDALNRAAADPAAFLQPNLDISQATRQAAKALLQYTVTSSTTVRSAKPADQQDHQQQQQQATAAALLADLQQQLHVGEDFDSEQVWLQLDMQLAPLRKRLRKLIGQLADEGASAQLQLVPPEVEAGIDAVLGEGGSGSEHDDDEEGSEGGDGGDSEGLDDMEDEEGDEDDEMEDGEGDGEQQRQQQKRGSKPAKKQAKLLPVEDRFFRLDDMEAFVAQAEREAAGLDDDDDDAAAGGGDDDMSDGGGEGSDDEGPGFGGLAGSDLGSDDDADLEDLLTSSAALVGKQRGVAGAKGKKQKQQDDSDDEEDDDDDDDGGLDGGEATYKDFFGDDGEGEEGLGGSEEEGEEGASDEFEDGRRGRAAAAAAGGRAGGFAMFDDDEDAEGDEEEEEQPLSTHEKRLLRMQERIAELEGAAMSEKPWQLTGEVSAARRPLNSALEVDMDYDTTNRPPPAPTEETTQSLEDIIKRRIAESRWDDVVRVVPPPAEVKKKQLVELDDTKAQQGLGEVYEQQYVQQVTGFAAPDKSEPLRRQALALFKTLCGKLDALSSFAFTPKPVVEELEVRSDVAALALEEVAPLAVSDATLRTPGEVFVAEARGEAKAEGELTKEERRRRRAKKKRTHKAKEAAKEAEAAARAAASGDATATAGRKSLAKQLAAATSSGLIKKGVVAAGGVKSDFGKSSAVFGKIAEQAAAGGKGSKDGKKPGNKDGQKQLQGAMLKL